MLTIDCVEDSKPACHRFRRVFKLPVRAGGREGFHGLGGRPQRRNTTRAFHSLEFFEEPSQSAGSLAPLVSQLEKS
jgi:hypothetical protein